MATKLETEIEREKKRLCNMERYFIIIMNKRDKLNIELKKLSISMDKKRDRIEKLKRT